MTREVSEIIVLQRIRNRIIEYLEMASSTEQKIGVDPNELINLWEDWVDDARIAEYVEPVFSKDEQIAMQKFHSTWNELLDNTPNPLPSIEELQNLKTWKRLTADAGSALTTFLRRGKLSEENENS